MKNFNTINNSSNKKSRHHIVISEENYSKLRSLGRIGDTFDKVLGELLSKNSEILESASRVGTLDQTLTSNIDY